MTRNTIAMGLMALAFAGSAHAGFIAQSGNDAVTLTDSTPGTGDSTIITTGTFSSYTPDGPSDPQITAGDLNRYGYTLNVTGTVPNAGGGTTYVGTYELFYNLDANDTRDLGDLRVASGLATLQLELVSVAGSLALQVTSGSLTQLLGPQTPPFADLSYGGSDIGLAGFFLVPVSGGPTTGTANLTFIQVASVPEPTTLAALAGASVLGLRRRRAKLASAGD